MSRVQKVISVILVISFLLCSFCLSPSAASAVTYHFADFEILADSDVPFEFRTDKLNGKPATRVTYTASQKVKVSAFRKISDEFKSGNSYTLTFTVRKGTVGDGYISFLLLLSDSPTSIDNAIELVSFHTGDMAQGAVQDFSIQTSYPDDFNGKQCYLVALIVSNGASGTYITDFVFTNNNQTEEKIDGILEWLSATYHGIVGGEDSRGVKHDGLVQGIKNGLNSLGDRLVNSFNNIKISIEGKIDAIKQWFDDLGEKIAEGFDYIVDMILYFEHPVEKNADGVPINTDTGQPVYTNPFDSVWKDIQSKLNEWIEKISDFIDSMNSARDNIVSYLDTGKQLIDGVIKGVPIIGALFIFVAGFHVIRKVVGQ